MVKHAQRVIGLVMITIRYQDFAQHLRREQGFALPNKLPGPLEFMLIRLSFTVHLSPRSILVLSMSEDPAVINWPQATSYIMAVGALLQAAVLQRPFAVHQDPLCVFFQRCFTQGS